MTEKKNKCCGGHGKGYHDKEHKENCGHDDMSQKELLIHLKECLDCTMGKLECIRNSLNKISVE